MRKKYFKYQLICCICIMLCAYVGKTSNVKIIKTIYNVSESEVNRCISREDVEAWSEATLDRIKGTPAHLVSVMVNASENSAYGVPIDEEATDDIKTVHAVSGGVVIASGYSGDLGLYVKIKHEGKVSTYGNLTDISVVVDERVERGEYIGYYDVESKEEFYYELEDTNVSI